MAGGQGRAEGQMSLFGTKSLNPVLDLKRELGRAAKSCGLSREQIVDRMNALISLEKLRTRGRDGLVTLDMLNKWLAPEAPDLPPLKLLPAVCKVMGSAAAIEPLVTPLGCRIIGPEEILLLEYAQAHLAERRAAKRKRHLEEQIKEIGV